MTSGAEEAARLAALHSYRVLDGPRPPALDELARLAARIFDTPMASVSLIDRDRQWLAGNAGMPDGDTPREISFCARTVPTRAPLAVPDARSDDRFRAWANVTGAPHIRLYDGSPLIDDDGHALGAFCVLDDRPGDVSDRRREALDTFARQAVAQLSLLRGRLLLAELGDELARATQREEDLIATVSHELRTPVTNIRGYLELLADDDRLSDLSRLVEPIHRNGERLVGMVEHLLDGTRPADAPLSLQRVPAELHLVTTAAAQAARTTAEQRGVELVVEAPLQPVVVHADVARLTQAALQLIRNAVLFTPAGGRVAVRTTVDLVAAIEVADTGVGVPPDELPYVFQRFFRGRHARRQAVPGVGLGLHIAQQAAAAHGGRITLTSSPSGTIARLTVS
ncbi:ATP-binding protein [Dactylosporangium sucinum]|uniref:histidine kinase n=1 Tax=Dactylosporangium sucinum TaxID=1424081 RepID=A0A917TMI7_9ACTN|nr:GAF domain-containing sensor histidine kinase [Dactylosporangium sucinum]GGM28943.1 sensor histidine kinase [Dactylosporangium sucinum]